MFAITSGKGFHITFPSGITFSTQFGGGDYCSNYHSVQIGKEGDMQKLESQDVEIAIFEKGEKGKWLTRKAYKECLGEELNDDVNGNVFLDEWLKILDWCKAYKPEEMQERGREEQ